MINLSFASVKARIHSKAKQENDDLSLKTTNYFLGQDRVFLTSQDFAELEQMMNSLWLNDGHDDIDLYNKIEGTTG